MSNHTDDAELIRAKLNTETAKIPWLELQRYFAAGQTLYISPQLDLIEVAYAFQQDQVDAVAHWRAEQLLTAVTNEQATTWFSQQQLLWAVVVKPWVLLQLPEDQADEYLRD